MKRHDLAKKMTTTKINTKTKTKTKTMTMTMTKAMTKTNTFREHSQRATLETQSDEET